MRDVSGGCHLRDQSCGWVRRRKSTGSGCPQHFGRLSWRLRVSLGDFAGTHDQPFRQDHQPDDHQLQGERLKRTRARFKAKWLGRLGFMI